VATVRARKARGGKPFAVMVRDLDAARALAEIDDAEAAVLTSPARPVVLLRRRPGAALAEAVAPDNRGWGCCCRTRRCTTCCWPTAACS
jgi:hydrogenase maturation protein HypF